MTCDDMSLTKIIVEMKKFFITNEKNVLFAMIDSENDK